MPLLSHVRSLSTLFAFTLAMATAASAQNDTLPLPGYHWIGGWGASPSPIPGQPSPVYSNQTIREVVRMSASSACCFGLRVRLSNALSNTPVTFDDVHAALSAGTASSPTSINSSTDRQVTFNGGSTSVTIPAGAEVLSDPAVLFIIGGSNVAISMHLPANTTPATLHYFATATSYIVPGDATAATALTNPATSTSRPYLSGVDVMGLSFAHTIVAVGDSITDGAYTTPDANLRWTDLLSTRLNQAFSYNEGVVNAGIAGEEILADNTYSRSLLTRIDKILAVPDVKRIILLEGINDICNNPGLPASSVIAGYRQVIARAHEKGVQVIGATITPVKGFAPYYTVANDQVRNQVNAFIRTSGAFDGVIDFDKAVADPSNPAQWLPAYTADFLHPNNTGSQVMANAIDIWSLSPFTVTW